MHSVLQEEQRMLLSYIGCIRLDGCDVITINVKSIDTRDDERLTNADQVKYSMKKESLDLFNSSLVKWT
ncbi:hypothetical protein MAR_019248 [Mya arenaria]|uniref:Uncharacterized protein n=1 Tax=Mya arenaria TaxID=6604 RepID=A0ABY7EH16_MYAAR|nr:hypothetical protein MAR_019248 [Mya arenaria]